MIKNYLTIAFRALSRNKVHSAINIIGLSVGIACCLLISLYVYDEWTFDTFHSKANRIFRVFGREDYGPDQQFFYTTTPFPMGPALKENLPEVEGYVRIVRMGTQVKVGNNQFSESLTIADRDLFSVFDFDLPVGDRSQVLSKQSNVVISDWLAEKYFGKDDPINKTISIQMGENFEEFTVTGVTKIPTNSSIRFYLLISDLNLPRLYNERVLTAAWFNINPETYVLLAEGSDAKSVTGKFPDLFKKILGEEEFTNSKYAPGLQPLTSIHLDNTYPVGLAPVSNPMYAYILGGIALLVLFIACINFVTLSVGRSMKRAKEVGIRKVVGAARKQLIIQFIGEALLVTFFSTLIGIGLAGINLSLFNDLAGKQLSFSLSEFTVSMVFVLLIIIGLIAGSYPAFVLSAFKPIAILKGNLSSANTRIGIRKTLVGLQLVLAIFLISSSLVMQNQLEFLQNKNLGFQKEQLAVVQLNIPRSGRLTEQVAAGFVKAEQFKAELQKFPEVVNSCGSSHDFANGGWTNIGFTDDQGTYRTFNLNVVDDDYIPTLKMDLVSGRNFSDALPADKRRSVIVNEAFVRAFGWTEAAGKKIPGKNFTDHEIIGVVKDFNYSSLYTAVEPLVMVEDPAIILAGTENINIDNSPVPKLMVRLSPGNMGVAIDKIKAAWAKIAGGEEFSFAFVDEALAAQYRADQNLGRIVRIATLLAIVIGSLGLYGLASLAMQNRVKEISIRKVLGATERSLLLLLSKDYVFLMVISLVVSVPITLYLMQQWLSTFEYRIEIGWVEFVLAGVISLAVALLTISYQTIKTAWTQPADTLKYE